MKNLPRLCAKWVLLLTSIWLAGCAENKTSIQPDTVNFGKDYADACNDQLLLNLARLANDEPVNFLQLGSFSLQNQIGVMAGVMPSDTYNFTHSYPSSATTPVGSAPGTAASSITQAFNEFTRDALTFGGSASWSANEEPIYQYFPLAGSNLVDAVIDPMSPNIFYTLYDQGWPADLVARTTVALVTFQSIETNQPVVYNYAILIHQLTNIDENFLNYIKKTCNPDTVGKDTIRVSPPISQEVLMLITNYIPDKISSELTSIQIQKNSLSANILRLMNNDVLTNSFSYDITTGIATITVTNMPPSLVNYITNSLSDSLIYKTNYEYLVNSPDDISYPRFLDFCSRLYQAQVSRMLTVGSGLGGNIIFATTNLASTNSVKLTDLITAVQANLAVDWDTNHNRVTVSQPPKQANQFIENTNVSFSHYDPRQSFTNAINIVATEDIDNNTNFTADTRNGDLDFASIEEFARDFKANRYTLKMRTFEAAMYTVAKEEGRFRNLQSIYPESSSQKYMYKYNALDTYEIADNDYAYDVITNYYSSDVNGPYVVTERPDHTHIKVRPLIRLTCGTNSPAEVQPEIVLADIYYGHGKKKHYFIGDPVINEKAEIQNREVFTLLTYLFAQTTVSSQNLPVQQLIQVQ
jgi:hypothetical protein